MSKLNHNSQLKYCFLTRVTYWVGARTYKKFTSIYLVFVTVIGQVKSSASCSRTLQQCFSAAEKNNLWPFGVWQAFLTMLKKILPVVFQKFSFVSNANALYCFDICYANGELCLNLLRVKNTDTSTKP